MPSTDLTQTGSMSAQDGLCECGCGEKTRLAPQTDPRHEHIKGRPVRFVKGHNGRRPLEERFAEKVSPASDLAPNGMAGCLLWGDGQGYGSIYVNGSLRKAHRVAWEQAGRSIPENCELDHLCRRPACVNPAHLEAVTHAVNNQRGDGAKLSPLQVGEIRALRSAGWLTADVAAAYDVHPSTVYQVTRCTWANV